LLGKKGKGRASHAQTCAPCVSTIRTPLSASSGLLAGSSQKANIARRYCIWIRSSRRPFEYFGRPDSEERGSRKRLGWLVPLSTAAQPISVKRIGLLPGTQGLGVAWRTPPMRS